ncbi:MAG: AsmA family protein, partial [Rickettsiales bacterium]|nr:AsmA family protein [Rickettsiales bacterium]
FFAPLFATAATTDAEVLNRRLPWLNTINQRIFLNLLFEDFSLGQRKGIRSRFVASLEKDKVQFDTIEVNLEGASIRGVASFNQKDDLPLLTTQLHVSDYNLNSLFGTGHIQHPVPRGNMVPVWSSQPWETSFLRGYDSKMSIQIDRATHDSFSAKNLSFEAESTNGEWSIENIKADMWGGTLQSNVHLDVSSVPTFTTSFYLTNIRLEAFLKSLAGFEGLQGLSSLSAEISSSGISAADFVKNANGSVAFKGRDILLQGFDLASLVQTVPAVRSVADVVNTVRIATLRGFSSFSIVEGGFYFSQGALGTQGITFRSRHALGSYVGSIDLMRWIIQAAIQFKLISIATDEYPAVTVTLKDSLDQPIIDLDARSLEAWVARQKLIQ